MLTHVKYTYMQISTNAHIYRFKQCRSNIFVNLVLICAIFFFHENFLFCVYTKSFIKVLYFLKIIQVLNICIIFSNIESYSYCMHPFHKVYNTNNLILFFYCEITRSKSSEIYRELSPFVSYIFKTIKPKLFSA